MSASPTQFERALIAVIRGEAGAQQMDLKQLAAQAGVNYRSALRYLTPDASDWREMSVMIGRSFASALGTSFGELVDRATDREEKMTRTQGENLG